MIDFFGSDGFFAAFMSARDAFVVFAPLMEVDVEIAASNGFLRESLSLL